MKQHLNPETGKWERCREGVGTKTARRYGCPYRDSGHREVTKKTAEERRERRAAYMRAYRARGSE